MEIWTKEEWYKLKGESCKARNAQKEKKSPTKHQSIWHKGAHSRSSESRLSKNASHNLGHFYVLIDKAISVTQDVT